jgi:hypothetical protein
VTITLQLTPSSWKVLDNARWQPLSALSKDYSSQGMTWYWLPPASWMTICGWGRLSVQGVDKRVKCSILPFSPRGGFLCGNSAPLFFTCFDYVVLLWVGSADLGHRRLHSSRPMDFNKRRETPLIAYWQISRSWIVLSHNSWIIEPAQRNPYERPRLTTQGSMETARSAAGRRKAR